MRKDVPMYEGIYQASEEGVIKSLDRKESCINSYTGSNERKRKGRILRPHYDTDGYLVISICKDGKKKNCKLSRLIALTFLPNPDNLPQINHEDGNKKNNNVSNLKWCTSKYNIRHARRNGLSTARKLGDHSSAKKIKQLTLNGELIKVWGCMTEAAKELKLSRTQIRRCCYYLIDQVGGYKREYN